MIRNGDAFIFAAVNRLHIDINFVSIKIVEIWNSFIQNYSKLKKHQKYVCIWIFNYIENCICLLQHTFSVLFF